MRLIQCDMCNIPIDEYSNVMKTFRRKDGALISSLDLCNDCRNKLSSFIDGYRSQKGLAKFNAAT